MLLSEIFDYILSHTAAAIAALLPVDKISKFFGVWHVYLYGARGDGSTDDTVAINAAIAAWLASGRDGKIYFPAGRYIAGSPLQDTSASNAQFPLPKLTTVRVLLFKGPSPAPTIAFTKHNGAVIVSTLATGTGAVIAGKGTNSFPISGANYISFHIDGVSVELPANPTNTGVDLTWIPNHSLKNMQVYAGDPASIVEPTTSTSYGIKLPPNNVPDAAMIKNVQVFSVFNGVKWGELTHVDDLIITFCKVAMELPTAFHAMLGGRIWVGSCPTVIKATGGPCHVEISQLDIEHQVSPAWVTPVADIADPDDLLDGEIGFHLVTGTGGLGVTDDLIVTGNASCKLKLNQLFTRGWGPALTISGNVLSPNYRFHAVGAGLIKTLSAPVWFQHGGIFYLVAGATPFTVDTSDNFARALTSAEVHAGQVVPYCYSPSDSKWHPLI